jgi:hypothetical protein
MENIIYIPVEISYNTRNSTNVSLAIIIIIGFILFSLSIATQLFTKLYTDKNINYLDITNAPLYSLSDVLKNVATGYRDISSNIYVTQYKNNLKTFMSEYEKGNYSNSDLSNNMFKTKDQQYTTLKSTLDSIQNITNKLTTLQNTNVAVLESIYIGYQTQIQNYITGLINMLKNINKQITLLNGTSYSALIAPLSRIFTTIRSTLVNNKDTIQTIWKGYNPDNLGLPVSLSPVTNLNPTTNTAQDILRLSGY